MYGLFLNPDSERPGLRLMRSARADSENTEREIAGSISFGNVRISGPPENGCIRLRIGYVVGVIPTISEFSKNRPESLTQPF